MCCIMTGTTVKAWIWTLESGDDLRGFISSVNSAQRNILYKRQTRQDSVCRRALNLCGRCVLICITLAGSPRLLFSEIVAQTLPVNESQATIMFLLQKQIRSVYIVIFKETELHIVRWSNLLGNLQTNYVVWVISCRSESFQYQQISIWQKKWCFSSVTNTNNTSEATLRGQIHFKKQQQQKPPQNSEISVHTGTMMSVFSQFWPSGVCLPFSFPLDVIKCEKFGRWVDCLLLNKQAKSTRPSARTTAFFFNQGCSLARTRLPLTPAI